MRKLIPVLFLIQFISACHYTKTCDEDMARWEKDAQKKLHDFIPAGYEIVKHKNYFLSSDYYNKTHWIDKNDQLDSSLFHNLKSYLQQNECSIFINPATEEIRLDFWSWNCYPINFEFFGLENNDFTYYDGLLLYTRKNPEEYYRLSREKIISLKPLGNYWYYILTECKNCKG